MIKPEFSDICQKLAKSASGALRVYGVRRSGQHAIIDWILRNCGQKDQIFLNNRRFGQSPLRLGVLAKSNSESTPKAQALAAQLAYRLSREQRPFLLISYENGFSSTRFESGEISPGFANKTFSHEVLVTRSFSNWLPPYIRLVQSRNPSRSAEGLDNCRAIIQGIEIYKAHIEAVINEDHLIISYDDWVMSSAYRLKMLAILGLETVDNSIGEVQPFGGGSSFTGLRQAPDAEALTGRWRALHGSTFAAQFIQLMLEDERFMANLTQLYSEEGTRLRRLIAQT